MPDDPIRILVFVGTKGVHHDHLGQGRFLTELLNQEPQIQAHLSRDYQIMADSLDHYDATLFFTDKGNLTPKQEKGLLTFIEKGGGFFGLHTAAASFPDNPGYHRMLNGFFDGHSPYMDFTVKITDATDPIAVGLKDFSVTSWKPTTQHATRPT